MRVRRETADGSPRRWRWLALSLLVGLALVLITYLNHGLVITVMEGMVNTDFMSVWGGARALMVGLDPYDVEAWPALRSQYGSTWFPDPTCPFPAWALMFFVPLALLPISVAGAIWLTVSEISLVVSIPMLLKATGSNEDSVVRIGLVLGAMASRPFLASLFNGQMVPVLLPVLAGAVLLYSRGHRFWFGFLLASLITKPNLFPFFFVALGLLLLLRRDWRAIGGLAAGGAALTGVSWVMSPGWLFRWLRVGTDMTANVTVTPTLWGAAFDIAAGEWWMPASIAASILAGLAALALMVHWRDQWLHALGLILSVSLLTTPYLRAYDHVLLLLPTVTAAVSGWDRRWPRLGSWLGVGLVFPWILRGFAAAYGSDQWSALVPMAVVVYLVVARWRERRREPGRSRVTGQCGEMVG